MHRNVLRLVREPLHLRFSYSSLANKDVKIVEVGPRDGLQNEKSIVPVETRVNLVKKLIQSGQMHIEIASFVSPKKIPAMADSSAVCEKLKIWRDSAGGIYDSVVFSGLCPNLRGMEDVLKLGVGAVDEVAIFASASEAFSQKNIGCSIDDSFARFQVVTELALQNNIPVRGYVSCVMGCPYSENVHEKEVVDVVIRLIELGCHEISLGDTIGVGTALQAKELIRTLKHAGVDSSQLAVHFHDTYGQALTNIFSCLEEDIRTIDSSVAGLGGCPYAKGASGNVATEDVVYMLHGMGMNTGDRKSVV